MVGEELDKEEMLYERIVETRSRLIDLGVESQLVKLVNIDSHGIQRTDEFSKMYSNENTPYSLMLYAKDLERELNKYRETDKN